jgi:hypothetical protein
MEVTSIHNGNILWINKEESDKKWVAVTYDNTSNTFYVEGKAVTKKLND